MNAQNTAQSNLIYYVWKRHTDGYVGSSCGRFPKGWTSPDGTEVTFELLGQFEEWFGSDGARECLKKHSGR